MYICAIREMDVYLYIGMRGNFEKNFLFTLTRSGYVESAASGIYAGLTLANQLNHKLEITLPQDTMLGALSAYISNPMVEDFQPMGANMGILPPLTERIKNKQLRYETIAARGLESLHRCLEESV